MKTLILPVWNIVLNKSKPKYTIKLKNKARINDIIWFWESDEANIPKATKTPDRHINDTYDKSITPISRVLLKLLRADKV